MSRDGGQTWISATVPAGTGVLQSAACPSAVALPGLGIDLHHGQRRVPPPRARCCRVRTGARRGRPPRARPVDDGFGLACPTAQLCALVGANWSGNPAVGSGAVAQSRDGGTSSALSAAYAPITLTAVACPSTAGCVAVGGDVVARVTLVSPPTHSTETEHTDRRGVACRRPRRSRELRCCWAAGHPASLGRAGPTPVVSAEPDRDRERRERGAPAARAMEDRDAQDLPPVSERDR